MINIRLQRRGRKNDPSFRVIVVDSKKKPKTGNYLEMVGSYDPRTDRVELKGERILAWMKDGAQVSGTVHNLLVSNKIITGKKINVLPKKTLPTPPASEVQAVPVAAASVAAPEAPAAEAAPAEVSTPDTETPVAQEDPTA
jgi:small subunit ribosomal protein S16